jgi:hypothetical protein
MGSTASTTGASTQTPHIDEHLDLLEQEDKLKAANRVEDENRRCIAAFTELTRQLNDPKSNLHKEILKYYGGFYYLRGSEPNPEYAKLSEALWNCRYNKDGTKIFNDFTKRLTLVFDDRHAAGYVSIDIHSERQTDSNRIINHLNEDRNVPVRRVA